MVQSPVHTPPCKRIKVYPRYRRRYTLAYLILYWLCPCLFPYPSRGKVRSSEPVCRLHLHPPAAKGVA